LEIIKQKFRCDISNDVKWKKTTTFKLHDINSLFLYNKVEPIILIQQEDFKEMSVVLASLTTSKQQPNH